jgi:hypothetical protein
MSVQEIESAIEQLNDGELAELAAWFAQHHMDKWDDRIASDSRSGKFDTLIAEAEAEFISGNCRRL